MTLSADQLRDAICTFGELLRSHREVINRLNVYPVPDGDTGTNMTLTIESVIAELASLDGDATMESVSRAIAHGSLMGARGNSGVILSQLLRGLVEYFPLDGGVDPELLAESLEHADSLARQAVRAPHRRNDPVDRARRRGGRAQRHDLARVAGARGARTSQGRTRVHARTTGRLEAGGRGRLGRRRAAVAGSTPCATWWPTTRCPSRRRSIRST